MPHFYKTSSIYANSMLSGAIYYAASSGFSNINKEIYLLTSLINPDANQSDRSFWDYY